MSTFIDLTNQTLRRLNEVELEQSDFLTTRGVQSLAKDAVRNSIVRINQSEFTWPFNAAEIEQTLTPGQEEYVWPQNFKVVDWDSFQIQADSTLGVDFLTLKFISRDEYYRRYRDIDQSAGADGISMPTYVFPSHGNGYGVSPSPDKAYKVKLRYYLNNVPLINPLDETRIPSVYDHVIVEGALYHMYMFRDNIESANMSMNVFDQGVKEMRTLFINKYNKMYDTRVAY
jgi:hypothetical protein